MHGPWVWGRQRRKNPRQCWGPPLKKGLALTASALEDRVSELEALLISMRTGVQVWGREAAERKKRL
jgi:hypothetical protein